jgi:hypothetical protein
MTRSLAFGVLLALAMPAAPAAHQLDEYLQAARISLARDRVAVEIDLTPGANIAGDIIAMVDRDSDGVVLPLEARAYGDAVVGDLELTFDGRQVRLALSAIEVPSIGEVHGGVGTMQLTATAVLDDVRAGRRQLRFSNRHHPEVSVYLANALVSTDRDLHVVAQRRDRRQQVLDVEYEIVSSWPRQVIWVLFGATLVVSRIVRRS